MSNSESKTPLGKVFMNGIINENPTFRLVLGTCPTLAVTTSATNSVGMGLAATFVLIGSNFVISLLKNFIPDQVRIPCYVVVIATFVTIVEMLLKAYVPVLYDALGIFIPLIVVNCIILARAEAFAGKSGAMASVIDGVGMGLGFTLSLTLIGIVREILGKGQLFGISLFGANFEPIGIFSQPPGGFFTFGILMGIVTVLGNRIARKRAEKANLQTQS